MPNENHAGVAAAFDILLEEIETDIESVNKGGSRAFEKGDYDADREALELGGELTGFCEKVASLRKEWDRFGKPVRRKERDGEGTEHRRLAKLRKGLRTPEEEYFVPVLAALAEAGGRGRMSEILEKVHVKMRGVLRDVDHEPLASDPDMPRWRNAAQWARNTLVKDGLMSADSPRGIWEISPDGRKFLAARKSSTKP